MLNLNKLSNVPDTNMSYATVHYRRHVLFQIKLQLAETLPCIPRLTPVAQRMVVASIDMAPNPYFLLVCMRPDELPSLPRCHAEVLSS